MFLTLTPRIADKLIASGKIATFRDCYGDTFTGIATKRERRTINIALYYANGEWKGNGLFDRSSLTVIV